MKAVKYNIDGSIFEFSEDAIKLNYLKKDEFIADVYTSNPNVNKAKLKKALDRVWNEIYPNP